MNYKIALLPGDGIGPEVIDATVAVLGAVGHKFGHNFDMHRYAFGGNAIDMTGVPLPPETLDACKAADGVLIGAIGGPAWDNLMPHMRPEKGMVALQSALGTFARVCPAVLDERLGAISSLRSGITKKGFDILLVREVSSGIFCGEHGYRDGALGQEAYDNEVYSINEVERAARVAFELALTRDKHVTSVDQANLLTTGRLWRATVERVAKSYPTVKVEHLLSADCAAKLALHPAEFDVLLTSNMFGEFLFGQLAAMCGSFGMLPSGSVGGAVGLYMPVHGSAPDIAGKDAANPIAAILSAAMMLSSSLKLEKEATAIDTAVKKTLAKGLRTKDISGGKKAISCSRMGEEIAMAVLNS